MKKICILGLVALLFNACSTQKNVTGSLTQPVGIEFSRIENFKGFSVINLPRSGKGFTENKNVNVVKNQTDAGVFVPGVNYENAQLMIFPDIAATEGDLDAQYEVVKKRFIDHRLKKYPDAKLVYEKTKVGDKEVAHINFRVDQVGQSIYGYIIPHNNMAVLLLIDVIIQADNLQSFENTMGETMTYMIQTMEFQEK